MSTKRVLTEKLESEGKADQIKGKAENADSGYKASVPQEPSPNSPPQEPSK